MKYIKIEHLKSNSRLYFILIFTILIIFSCKKNCPSIVNNSYKGCGFFIYKPESRDGKYQIYFIPVCNKDKSIICLSDDLRPLSGIIFHCTSTNKQFRDVFIYSKPFYDFSSNLFYASSSNPDEEDFYRYLPVYIEFEGISFDEMSSGKKQRESIYLPNKKKYDIDFTWIPSNINDVIKVNDLQLLGITRESKFLTSDKDRDNFINRYKHEEFSDFENILIGFLGEDTLTRTYFIDKENGGSYFVKYNLKKDTLDNISHLHIVDNKAPLSSVILKKIIKDFMSYNIYMLKKDKEGNIFINPYEINAPAYYMKFNKNIDNDSIMIINDFAYKKYKNNWYINQDYNRFLGR
jgi:hypothetical protein